MARAQKKAETEELWQALGAIARRRDTPLPTDGETEISITRRIKKLDCAKRLVELQRIGRPPLTADEMVEKRELVAAMADPSVLDARPLPKVDPIVKYPMPRSPSIGRLSVHSKLHEAVADIVARTSALSEPAEPVTVQQIVESEGGLVCVTGDWMASASPDMQRIVAESDPERVVVMQAEHFLKWRDVPGFSEHVNGRQLVIVS